ncbi:hypothetical protein [Mucilaginibacter sp. AK015]|uniref:hypothetical protein n=1 Tax=Mucilaginibacter sp. AK015 TaxID=2723072 RepID=UPI00161B5BEB|nr:hypothetical protein [Mucilaginibacter sp. AK015]MBB5394751.1 hypothetical protein [Mucilaginibacter sp. AK015]
MTTNKIDVTTIPGYGMDADPENEPTYPMKHYTGDDHNRINYERSVQQPQTVEILQSTERPAITTVFGTSVPPSGLSGAIRRYAFKHSEDRYRHWLPLIFADRINVFEGVIEDLRKGHVPNVFAERGWKVEMKHNAVGFLSKLAITALVTAAIVTTVTRKK